MIKLKELETKNYVLINKAEILYVKSFVQQPIHSVVCLKNGDEFFVEESIKDIEVKL